MTDWTREHDNRCAEAADCAKSPGNYSTIRGFSHSPAMKNKH